MSSIAPIQGITGFERLTEFTTKKVSTDNNKTFESLFESALGMVKETQNLTNAAEEQEIAFALGTSDNLHDLTIAQSKATVALNYTIAVRKTVLDAYKEIMNMQF